MQIDVLRSQHNSRPGYFRVRAFSQEFLAHRARSEHTQQRLPQVRMCIRVRNVSPKCSTWLRLGSWGWGRLHSNVGHPKSKRESACLVDRNHISTHRFSGQKWGVRPLSPILCTIWGVGALLPILFSSLIGWRCFGRRSKCLCRGIRLSRKLQ